MTSLQLTLYRRARYDGVPLAEAATLAGISRAEAALHDADDERNPPPADAYRMTPGMARHAVGALADLPLGAAAVSRLSVPLHDAGATL